MKLVKLGNLASIQTGKIDVNKAVVGGKYPFFTCSRDVYQINDAPFEGKAVLVAGNGDLNVKYYAGKFNAYQRTYILFVNNEEELLPRYLYWFLESYVGQLRSESIGSTIKYIKMGNLTDAEIPLLSLGQQTEIVEKIDSATAEIELLEKNLGLGDEKVQQLFKSMLSTAFSSSKDTFEHVKSEYNQNHSVKMLPLKEICTVFGDGDWIESKDQSESGIRLIQTGNVGEGVFKDRIEKARWISEETFKKLRCTEIGEGDVLVSRLPDPVGRACILPALEQKAITAVDCSILRFDEKIMDPKFFVYYSQSSAYESSIRPLISGSTRERISREKLGTIMIPIPSLEEQHKIGKKLDIAFAEIELLKSKIQIGKSHVAALRQSTLSSAFSNKEAVA